jgi:DNA polymerase delta subunit 1
MSGLSVEEAIIEGQAIAKELSKHYSDPIKLEFEKIYFPSLFLQRKRYAGLQWTSALKPDKIECKVISSNGRLTMMLLEYDMMINSRELRIHGEILATFSDICSTIF